MNLDDRKADEEGASQMGTFYVGHPENRSLLEISRCIGSIRNRKRIKRFDIASLTGQDEESSPGSPEIDVITVSTKTDSEPDAKRSRKDHPITGDNNNNPTHHFPSFAPYRDISGTVGHKDSAFRKVDKVHHLAGPNLSHNNHGDGKVLLANCQSLFAPDSMSMLGGSGGSFPEDRLLKSTGDAVVGRMYVKSDPLQAAVKSSYPLMPFMPPSIAALTFPTQNWCAKCNASFRMTSDLVYHMRSHHKREKDPMKLKREDKLRCDICHETFRERHHLTRHMTSHQ